MVYFYYRGIPKVEIFRRDFSILLTMEYEFSQYGQSDGHGHWHGNDKRGWAECVLEGMDTGPIASLLKLEGIVGMQSILNCSMDIIDLKKLDKDNLCPINLMKLRIIFVPEFDEYKSLANQLIKNVPWEVCVEAMDTGSSNSCDWEYGKKGKKKELKREDVLKILSNAIK